jgi:Cu/Ag efflux pump CusA
MKGGVKMNEEVVRIDLSEEELQEKKSMLENYSIQKDKTDLSLEEMIENLDMKIPSLYLDEGIESIKKDIKEGKNKDGTDASPTDILSMKIQLKYLEKTKKLDLPTRELRRDINNLRIAKNRKDSPEQQISKLKKEIKEKKGYTLKSRVSKIPTGVY